MRRECRSDCFDSRVLSEKNAFQGLFRILTEVFSFHGLYMVYLDPYLSFQDFFKTD